MCPRYTVLLQVIAGSLALPFVTVHTVFHHSNPVSAMQVSSIPLFDVLPALAQPAGRGSNSDLRHVFGTHGCLLDCQTWSQCLDSRNPKVVITQEDQESVKVRKYRSLVKSMSKSADNGCDLCGFFKALLDIIAVEFPSSFVSDCSIRWPVPYNRFVVDISDENGHPIAAFQLFTPKGKFSILEFEKKEQRKGRKI